MTAPVAVSERDLRILLGIVGDGRADLPAEGLAPSLLADLMSLIRCDAVTFTGVDSRRQQEWFSQEVPVRYGDADSGAVQQASDQQHWDHYRDFPPACYPDHTGDLRAILKISDFYSGRQWHGSGVYRDHYRPAGLEHELQLCLPAERGPTPGPGRTVRLFFTRGPGPDFSERDRALLALLRPHLHHAYLDAERRRHPVPRLTPRHWELLRLLAAGHTNTQIARRLGISEGTVRTHLENIYGRLQVSSRAAAVTRAFPDWVA